MNICFLTNTQLYEYRGGVEAVSVILSRAFLKDGNNVINCFSSFSDCGKSDSIDVINQYILPDKNICSETNISYFKTILERERIDVVMNETYNSEYHELCIAVKSGYPYKLVYTFHDDPFTPLTLLVDDFERVNGRNKWFHFLCHALKFPISCLLRYRGMKKRYEYYACTSSAFVLLSQTYKNQVKRMLGNRYENIYAISNPIEQTTETFEKKPNQVVFVGRLVAQKRVDRLLDVWKIVENQKPECTLIIVGDGELRIALEKQAQDLCLKHCTFVGAKPSKDYIMSSSVLCVTSTHEGLPMVILEAQQFGTVPIVFDSFGSAKDLIIHQENGILVRPFSKRQYANAIVSLMDNSQNRLAMSQTAKKFIQANYSERIVAQWYNLFNCIKS